MFDVNKKYGVCEIIKDEKDSPFEVLVQYYEDYPMTLTTVGDLEKLYVKDIITGTKIQLCKSAKYSLNNGKVNIKKDSLLGEYTFPLTKEKMIERLKSMTQEDIDKYVSDIGTAMEYQKGISKKSKEKIKNKKIEHKAKMKFLKLEIKRVKKQAKEA